MDALKALRTVNILRSGEEDPTAVAIDAPKGAVFFQTVAPFKQWRKQDDGETVNWAEIAGGGGGGGGGSTFEYPAGDALGAADAGKLVYDDGSKTAKVSIQASNAKAQRWIISFGAPSEPGTQWSLTDSQLIDLSPGVITEGVDWDSGADPEEERANVQQAMDAAWNIYGYQVLALSTTEILVDRTTTGDGAGDLDLSHNDPQPVYADVTVDQEGSDAEGAVPLGKLVAVDAGVATISSAAVDFLEASEAIAQDAFVGTAADGKIRTAPGGTPVCGRALAAAGAAGELIPVLRR